MKELTPEQIAQARKQIGEAIGHLGGNARAAKLSPRRRKQIAKKAAQARWAKRKDTDTETKR